MVRSQLEFSVGLAAIMGAREYQQDTMQVWPSPGQASVVGAPHLLVVLSDGMGGHVSGETASDLACRETIRHFTQTNGEPAARLEEALYAANGSIMREINANSKLAGMGCTLIAAYLDQTGLRWVSVGDSIIYLFRRNRLYRLNEDHSFGALLDKQAKAQVISLDEAQMSPHRRSLRSAVTGAKIPLVDLEREPNHIAPGDWLLVASDGLDTLAPDVVATVVSQYVNRDPQFVVDSILECVRRRNVQNQDNTSIIAIKVEARETVSSELPTNGGQTLRLDFDSLDDKTEIITPMRRGEIVAHVSTPEGRSSPTERLRTRSTSRRPIVRALCILLAALVLVSGLVIYRTGLTWIDQAPNSHVAKDIPSSTDKSPPPETKN
ncbi:MAG: protein phosphatase 2C domain-containing protein [Hyphomicrobiaceae bacterium]